MKNIIIYISWQNHGEHNLHPNHKWITALQSIESMELSFSIGFYSNCFSSSSNFKILMTSITAQRSKKCDVAFMMWNKMMRKFIIKIPVTFTMKCGVEEKILFIKIYIQLTSRFNNEMWWENFIIKINVEMNIFNKNVGTWK